MTREEAKEVFLNRGFIDGIYNGDKWREACVVISKWLEQEPTTKNDLGVDCISREAVNRIINKWLSHPDYELKDHIYSMTEKIHNLPSITPQEPKCKDCKWWKDSDGEYRRGCGAESQCPINRREVFEGNGYCFLFEPHESEDKE